MRKSDTVKCTSAKSPSGCGAIRNRGCCLRANFLSVFNVLGSWSQSDVWHRGLFQRLGGLWRKKNNTNGWLSIRAVHNEKNSSSSSSSPCEQKDTGRRHMRLVCWKDWYDWPVFVSSFKWISCFRDWGSHSHLFGCLVYLSLVLHVLLGWCVLVLVAHYQLWSVNSPSWNVSTTWPLSHMLPTCVLTFCLHRFSNQAKHNFNHGSVSLVICWWHCILYDYEYVIVVVSCVKLKKKKNCVQFIVT